MFKKLEEALKIARLFFSVIDWEVLNIVNTLIIGGVLFLLILVLLGALSLPVLATLRDAASKTPFVCCLIGRVVWVIIAPVLVLCIDLISGISVLCYRLCAEFFGYFWSLDRWSFKEEAAEMPEPSVEMILNETLAEPPRV